MKRKLIYIAHIDENNQVLWKFDIKNNKAFVGNNQSPPRNYWIMSCCRIADFDKKMEGFVYLTEKQARKRFKYLFK